MDVICLDDSSVDEEMSDVNNCQTKTAEATKLPIQISLTSPTIQNPTSKTLASIPSSQNQPSISISWQQNKPPGQDDPKCVTRNGFRWHWCKLCNNENGRWSSHSTEGHGSKVGQFDFISQQNDPMKKEADAQTESSESFGSTKKSNSEDPICLSSSEDEAPTVRRRYASTVQRVKRKVAMKTSMKALSKKKDVGNSKLVLHWESKKRSNNDPGGKVLSVIDLLDSDDDSFDRTSSNEHRTDLAVNNKYCADRSRKDMSLPCTITTEKVGGQGDQDAAQYRDSQNYSDAKDMQGEAIQILVSAEKELESRSHVPIKFAVLEEDKVFATDFVFYTMRQYMCDMFNRMDGSPHIGFGCLKCAHCNKKTSVKRASAMISRLSIYWKHLNEECEKVPKHVKEALVCLREFDKEQRKADSNIVNRKVMEAVFGHMISAGTLMPEDRSDDEDFGADDQDNVCASESLKIDESVSGQDLPEMRVVEWCKTLDKDHYPTVTVTAWNEKIDCLFDFKMFVAPSRITNSGNGAFLQLLRARLRNPVEGDLMAARCPLLAHDETGREIKVFVGPTTVHDDAGPSNDHRYVEFNSLTFSSWHDGCGSIDIGSYGPFLPSDIKQEAHYEVKNFLFDFEPQGWSYGLGEIDQDLVLDITNDETGETHLRARENIPMHVNEVGHNSELKQNVTPLEPDQGIHYYVHPQNPMKVGEVIELLVDYGEFYEEVRERKGYGKSNLGSDNVVSQRVKRNQGERVKIEDIILTQSLLENYELLISLQDTIVAVLNATDNCLNQSFTSEDTTRRWNARFRIHWIAAIFRHRCMTIRTQVDDFLCIRIFSILNRINNEWCLIDMVTENKILRPIAMNEYLEESVFLASRCHQLLHPLDPTMWCTFAREIVHDLGQDLILDIKTEVTSDAVALKLVYKCAKNASREMKRLCTFPAEIERLSFEKTENERIVKYLTNSSGTKNHASKFYLEECDSTGTASSQYAFGDQQSKHWVRWTKAQGSAASIDQNWYLLWQVVRVVHVLVKQCLSLEKCGYSLKTLCEHVGVDLRDAQAVLDMKMVEPYDEETFISRHLQRDASVRKNRSKQRSSQSQPRGRAPKRAATLARKTLLDEKDRRQISGFIPNASPNVVKNRESGVTFWKEEPGGDEFPNGWIIHIHKRQSITTGGRHIDRYWFTKGGKKLGTIREIERFLLALKLSKGNEELAVKIFEGMFQFETVQVLFSNYEHSSFGLGSTMERLLPKQIPTYAYIMGLNACGALTQNRSISLRPRRLSLPLQNDIVTTVYASDRRSFALTDTGVLFSWGSEPLGRKITTHCAQSKPRRIKSIKDPIAKVANGSKHSLLLTSDRCVYSFGDSADGKLGLDKKARGSVIFPQKLNVYNCLDIACGVSSSTLLLANGDIVTSGLTSGSTRKRGVTFIPCLFHHRVKVVSIACGSCHSVALSSDGQCFTWGCAENGRLGHGNLTSSNDMVLSPKRVELFCTQQIAVTAVACGSSHNLLLSSSGDLFGFGWSYYGQCGSNDDVWVPTIIMDVPEAISQVSCGFAHSAVITKHSGYLYSFGFNEDGQLGLGNEDKTHIPTRVLFDEQIKGVLHVDCGNLHTIAVAIPCTVTEYRRHQDDVVSAQVAVNIIQRFCLKIVYQQQLKKRDFVTIDSVSEVLANETINSIEALHSGDSEEVVCSDSTSLYSQSSSESVVKDSSPSTFQETSAMEAEDEISTMLTRRLERSARLAHTKKIRICLELLRRQEVCHMHAEDVISNKLKELRMKFIREIHGQKKIAMQEKILQDHIDREKRLEQRKQKSFEKKDLPVVATKRVHRRRKVVTRMKGAAKTILKEKHPLTPISQPRIPLLPSKNRNERLLCHREGRLRREEREQKEERERQARSLRDKRFQLEKLKERDKDMARTQSERLNSLLTIERRRNNRLLQGLKSKCHVKDDKPDVKEEFKTLKQWTRITTG